jgi:hypothetical protein
VVARWRAVGAHCLRTDLDGAVTFTSDGHDVEVATFLERPRVQARRGPRRDLDPGERRVHAP